MSHASFCGRKTVVGQSWTACHSIIAQHLRPCEELGEESKQSVNIPLQAVPLSTSLFTCTFKAHVHTHTLRLNTGTSQL